jgi:hypothetical protein
MIIRTRSYSESVESTDSEDTVTESGTDDGDHIEPSGVYRWQLKPVSLWDIEDVCQWLEIQDLGDLNPMIRGQSIECYPIRI